MSSEICKGCGEQVHDLDEHIEFGSNAKCRIANPVETESLRRLGMIT